jgi:hypothetical protein
MFKLLIGAALGFAAAAWFMDSKEGEQRRALVKEKVAGITGKGKSEGVEGGDSFASATSGEPIVETDPTSAPGPETFQQS